MSTPNATTFRFSEETRQELENIKNRLQAPTLQKTVEILIHRFAQDQADYSKMVSSFYQVDGECKRFEARLNTIKQAFKLLMDEGGEHG